MMVSNVGDLQEDAVYYFRMQATTGAGEGPATDIQQIQTQTGPQSHTTERPPQPWKKDKAQQIGIIVGVCIGGTCIAISVLIILLRNRQVLALLLQSHSRKVGMLKN